MLLFRYDVENTGLFVVFTTFGMAHAPTTTKVFALDWCEKAAIP
jgi:hypothetical protein